LAWSHAIGKASSAVLRIAVARMKMIVAGLGAYLVAFSLCVQAARADETAISLTLNATSGHHVESDRAESIPFLPLPILELEHVHKKFRIHLEGLPPIGPVPLAQSNQFAESMSPRVSYLSGELYYAPSPSLMFGVGETVLNQQTIDRVPFLQNSSSVSYSRVVGLRFAARAALYADERHSLTASIAASPAMHGLEDGIYSEYASFIDTSLRWSTVYGRYGFSYGLRYLNYTAGYSVNHSLADRNHLFMPFVGFDWFSKPKPASPDIDPPSTPVHYPNERASVGLSLLGSNGNRTFTQAYSDTPLSFVLIPDITASYTAGRFELQTEGILPNASANPFGASHNRWSYLNFDALARVSPGPLSFGLGETVTNLEPAESTPNVKSGSRSEAVDLIGRLRFAQTAASSAYVQLRLDPYVHVSESTTYALPDQPPSTISGVAHGARVDLTLGREVSVKRFVIGYGLRYINQTTNYGQLTPGALLTRTTTFMPFAGVSFKY
jgi:hypothetical protein